jgi:hypothetical protein
MAWTSADMAAMRGKLRKSEAEVKRLRELIGRVDNRLECADHEGGCWRCAALARSYLQEALGAENSKATD